jgi:hypothetical protein
MVLAVVKLGVVMAVKLVRVVVAVNFGGGDDGDIRAKQQLRFRDELDFLVRHCFTCEVRKRLLDLGPPCQDVNK